MRAVSTAPAGNETYLSLASVHTPVIDLCCVYIVLFISESQISRAVGLAVHLTSY